MTAHATTLDSPDTDTADVARPSTRHPRRSHPLERLASWRLWIASATLFVPFAFVFFASSAGFAIPEVEAACGQAPPDMRFYSSGDDVVAFLDACGPAGRDAYRSMQLADLVYPTLVGVFLASSLALVLRRLSVRHSLRWIAAVPLLAAAFDYLENAFAWLAIASYPEAIATTELLGFASAAKTSLSWGASLSLLACLAALGVRWVLRRARQQHQRIGVSS
ncbi:MAG: hypothetical protein ACRBI6_23150 [Acidimicrobiales bacterium]